MNSPDSSCQVYNRPARIERRFGDMFLVRWQDNGTQGHVPAGEIE